MNYKRWPSATADYLGEFPHSDRPKRGLIARFYDAIVRAAVPPSPKQSDPRAEQGGVLSLNEAQSVYFYKCMTKPRPLSGKLQAGIRKMQELSRRK